MRRGRCHFEYLPKRPRASSDPVWFAGESSRPIRRVRIRSPSPEVSQVSFLVGQHGISPQRSGTYSMPSSQESAPRGQTAALRILSRPIQGLSPTLPSVADAPFYLRNLEDAERSSVASSSPSVAWAAPLLRTNAADQGEYEGPASMSSDDEAANSVARPPSSPPSASDSDQESYNPPLLGSPPRPASPGGYDASVSGDSSDELDTQPPLVGNSPYALSSDEEDLSALTDDSMQSSPYLAPLVVLSAAATLAEEISPGSPISSPNPHCRTANYAGSPSSSMLSGSTNTTDIDGDAPLVMQSGAARDLDAVCSSSTSYSSLSDESAPPLVGRAMPLGHDLGSPVMSADDSSAEDYGS